MCYDPDVLSLSQLYTSLHKIGPSTNDAAFPVLANSEFSNRDNVSRLSRSVAGLHAC
jgi:hypothetical protein